MVGFAPVAILMIKGYDVSAFDSAFLVLIFHVLYIPLNFPANYLMDKFGMILPTIISGVLVIVGAWTRYVVSKNDDFNWITLGMVLMAAGNSFIVSGPPKLAVIWFGDNERALCTTIGSLAGAVGSILGYLLPIFFFSDYDI